MCCLTARPSAYFHWKYFQFPCLSQNLIWPSIKTGILCNFKGEQNQRDPLLRFTLICPVGYILGNSLHHAGVRALNFTAKSHGPSCCEVTVLTTGPPVWIFFFISSKKKYLEFETALLSLSSSGCMDPGCLHLWCCSVLSWGKKTGNNPVQWRRFYSTNPLTRKAFGAYFDGFSSALFKSVES